MNIKALAIIGVLVITGSVIAYSLAPSQSQPGEGAAMVSVDIPELSELEKAGETFYNASCAACHGVNVTGQDGIAPSFIDPIYQPNFHSDGAFYVAVQSGVRAHHWTFGSMPVIEGVSRDDVAAIVAYVRAVQRENGIE